jgi:hypothetical protein
MRELLLILRKLLEELNQTDPDDKQFVCRLVLRP